MRVQTVLEKFCLDAEKTIQQTIHDQKLRESYLSLIKDLRGLAFKYNYNSDLRLSIEKGDGPCVRMLKEIDKYEAFKAIVTKYNLQNKTVEDH